MKRDCDCHDDLGALNHVGDGRLDELYDEVLDEPEGDLGELEHVGASGVEWLDEDDLAGIELDDFDLEDGRFEDDGFEDGDEVGFISDIIDGGKAILKELTGPSRRESKRA